jgi:murein DD-endopeptidase MepM/ murein hydrolase activator NlpD
VLLKRAVLVGLALLVTGPAAAGEMQSPAITLSRVDWDAAAASLSAPVTAPPAEAFARLNALTGKRFVGIGKSAVPVLLPFDVDAFRKDATDGKSDAATSDKYFGDFHPTKFFLPGAAGYDATFTTSTKDAGIKSRFTKPIVIEISGAAFVYDLDGPDHQEVFPPRNGLDQLFPGMRRILREAHVRYAFERFGVPYVVSIQCYDQRTSAKYLSCKDADPIADKFLRLLHTAGGAPTTIREPKLDLSRPTAQSDSFTYYGPGDLIENTGWKKMPGRADYHVYARMRFPIADAPAYVKSQSFMPWGDCYRTGMIGRMGRKGATYRCKVNDKPLVFDESAAVNFTYPWRDNFCEQRDFLVGQCPGGYGHQGEDIRPANCVLFNAEADRCLPYQHTVAAVQGGIIRRMPGNLGAYIVVNTQDEHVRFRYLHMNPKMMDDDGLLNGRQVSQGEIIGKVATWGDFENGTSYHLHFNIQVFTTDGWVWVNPYMTLVAAYERLIGARGREIMPGEPAPPTPDKPPVILHVAPEPAAIAATTPLPPVKVEPGKAEPSKAEAAKTESTKTEPEKAKVKTEPAKVAAKVEEEAARPNPRVEPQGRRRVHRVRHRRRHKAED